MEVGFLEKIKYSLRRNKSRSRRNGGRNEIWQDLLTQELKREMKDVLENISVIEDIIIVEEN